MTTMTKPLPLDDKLAAYVAEVVSKGSFADEAEYLADLIRRDMEHRDEVVAALIEGEESGVCPQSMDEVLAEAKRDYLAAKNA